MTGQDDIHQTAPPPEQAQSRAVRGFDWALLGLLLAALVFIGVGGLLYYKKLAAAARADAQRNLAAVAELKVREIVQWRKEWLRDATYIRRTPYATRRALNVLLKPASESTREMFTDWLDAILAGGCYEQALLLNSQLKVCLTYPEQPPGRLSEPMRRAAEVALRTGQIAEADLYRTTEDGRVRLSLMVPLVVSREGTNDNVSPAGTEESPADRSTGVLVLQVDPQAFLYPLIQTWPIPSRTAETYLVRREGEEVMFLNELRHRKGTALSLRRPISAKDSLVLMAVRDKVSAVEGVDYRGVPVLAAARGVPDTPWFLVTKVDEEEVYADLRQEAGMLWSGMGLSAIASCLGISLIWRWRGTRLLRRQLEAEKERRVLAERIEVLMRDANDIILLMDERWHIVEANARAVENYGFSRDELLRLTLEDLRAPEARADFDRQIRHLTAGGCAILETVHQRKDGMTFPAEASLRVVNIAGAPYGVAFVRDITERKAREGEIKRLNRLYATLSQVNQAIVRCRSREELLSEVCRVAVEFGGFKTAWIGSHDPKTRVITPLACAGAPQDFVHKILHTSEEDEDHFCLCGLAIREGRPSLANDLRLVPELRHWQAAIKEAGMRSAAVFPIRLKGGVWGVFAVYATEPNVFLDREIAMLDETADDVAFGLEGVERERRQKGAEQALRESEEKYRLLVETAREAIYVVQGGIIRFANSAACRMVSASASDVVGRSILDLVPPEDRDAIQERHNRLLHGDLTESQREYRIIGRGGATLWLSVSAVRIVWNGEPATLNLASDITERKQAAARLSAFAALGERLSASRTDKEAARVIVDVADQLLGWDLCIFSQYSAAEDKESMVLGMDIINGRRTECGTVLDHLPPSPLARRAIEQGGQLVLRDQPDGMCPDTRPFGDTTRPSAAILYVPVRNGTEVMGLISIQSYTPRAYDQGSLETFQTLADHCGGTLARIRMQETLRVSEQRFRSVWENSIDGMRLTDRKGRILAVNEAYCKLVKLPREKLEGQTFSVVYRAQGSGEGMDVYRQRFDSGTILPHLIAHTWLWNSEEVDLEISNSFLDLGRQGKVVFSVFRNTTERKRLEAELHQSQKMEGIGKLAGGVAHDFNNLLVVIRGNAELLLMGGEALSAEARECLGHVASASERAANLTRQLLIFSRKQVTQFQPVALNELIGNLTKMLQRVISENIQLECVLGEPLPFIQADPGMVEQVLLNLVVNARDAMPKGGHLHIATERVRLEAADTKGGAEAHAGEFVRLSVTDTGTGIAPEVLPRIFEPFFTTKDVGKGTGLGLATVYGIVKQHQGWVDVSSRIGEGTTFAIFLPAITPPAQAAAAAPAEPEPRGNGETILLAEDDYSVRMITRRVLEMYQYKVLEAASSGEAIEVWSRHRQEIALLLTDIVMRDGMTGRDLADRLRSERPGLRLIFMSGYSAEVVGRDTDFFQRNKSLFIQKPCSADTLIRTVRQCLDEA
jgi:PAS domain S-box-containing protein